MKYPHKPGSKVGGTSEIAAANMSEKATHLQRACLRQIRQKQMTADEVAAKLSMSILAIRPRISELRAKSLIEPTGQRRRNSSGQLASVWRAVKQSA